MLTIELVLFIVVFFSWVVGFAALYLGIRSD